MLESILVIILLILFSAILSGSESALFSIDPSRLEGLKQTHKNAPAIERISEWISHPERTLSAILLGNLIINIALSETGHLFIESLLGGHVANITLISLVAITLFILIFGEVLPKVLALQLSDRWAVFWQPVLTAWFFVSRYLARPVYHLTRIITDRLPQMTAPMTEQTLVEAIHVADRYGILREEDKIILKRSIAFYYDTAYSAMQPKARVFMLPHTVTVQKARKKFIESRKDVAAIYHEKDGKITGFLNARTLVQLHLKKQKSIRNRMQPVLFVPETMHLKEVLQLFIEKNSELAAVIDESSAFSGIISLKDVLQKLMGEADDRSRELPANAKDADVDYLGGGIYRLSGSITMNDFNEMFSSSLEPEEAETLSGFLLEKLDGFPRNDTSIQIGNFEFYSMKTSNYLIEKINVRKV